MKRVLKRLKETKIGASPIPTGAMVVFAKNEEAWRGKVSEVGALRNGEPLYYVKNAVSDSGKVRKRHHGFGDRARIRFLRIKPYIIPHP
jgi:hypothetical protein